MKGKHPLLPNKCPWCEGQLREIHGRRGKFYGCTNFHTKGCRFTTNDYKLDIQAEQEATRRPRKEAIEQIKNKTQQKNSMAKTDRITELLSELVTLIVQCDSSKIDKVEKVCEPKKKITRRKHSRRGKLDDHKTAIINDLRKNALTEDMAKKYGVCSQTVNRFIKKYDLMRFV